MANAIITQAETSHHQNTEENWQESVVETSDWVPRRRRRLNETTAIFCCDQCLRRYTCQGNLNRHKRLKHRN